MNCQLQVLEGETPHLKCQLDVEDNGGVESETSIMNRQLQVLEGETPHLECQFDVGDARISSAPSPRSCDAVTEGVVPPSTPLELGLSQLQSQLALSEQRALAAERTAQDLRMQLSEKIAKIHELVAEGELAQVRIASLELQMQDHTQELNMTPTTSTMLDSPVTSCSSLNTQFSPQDVRKRCFSLPGGGMPGPLSPDVAKRLMFGCPRCRVSSGVTAEVSTGMEGGGDDSITVKSLQEFTSKDIEVFTMEEFKRRQKLHANEKKELLEGA